MSIVDVSSGPVFVVIACDVAKRIDCSSSHDNGWPCLDIYFSFRRKKIPKKYFVLIARERCVAMRIDCEDLPRSLQR